MKQYMSVGRMGFLIAAIVFLFTLTTVVQADARQPGLKTLLAQQGMSIKMERLDRIDGFFLGFRFKGPHKQSFVLAPGLDRMLLVITDSQEMIFQVDGTGNLQIIQASGDYTIGWCLLKALSTYFFTVNTCVPGEPSCTTGYLLVTLFTDGLGCFSGITP